jgi:hypothetical protein
VEELSANFHLPITDVARKVRARSSTRDDQTFDRSIRYDSIRSLAR